MNNLWAFGEMVESNDLLGEPNLLRHRMLTDGYLLLREVLRPGQVRTVHRAMVEILQNHGWLHRKNVAIQPVREGEEEYFKVYDDIQRLESFHTLAHTKPVMSVMREVVGRSAFPHPLKVARLVFPNNWEVSTPPHQDYPNNQGTANLTTAWVPLSDIPYSLGGVAVLPGSHLHGVQPLEFHLGPGNRQARLSPELRKLHWVTTEYRAGDLLLFNSHTMHAALNNTTRDKMRLSVDFRFQNEGEQLTDLVLEPHFGRLTWEDIYQDWKGTVYQYYWKRKRYEVVPFDPHRFDDVALTDANVLGQEVYQRRLEERWRDTNPRARARARNSELFDDIEGLDPDTRKRLAEELGGVAGVVGASREDLAAIEWLGPEVADALFERVQTNADVLLTEAVEPTEIDLTEEAEVEEAEVEEAEVEEVDVKEIDLTGIAGLGEKRRARLLEEAGGARSVAQLSQEDLERFTWLPEAVAAGVLARLTEEETEEEAEKEEAAGDREMIQ